MKRFEERKIDLINATNRKSTSRNDRKIYRTIKRKNRKNKII